MRSHGVALVCLFGLVSAPVVALDRPETDLRSNIEESVTVRRVHVPVCIEPTKKGRRNPGRCAALSPDDVVVTEDGVPAAVTAIDETLTATLHAILIDTSVSMRRRLDRAKDAALKYVAGLAPDEQVLVASFDDNLILRTPPTTDRERIEKAIETLEVGNNTALWDSLRYLMRYLEPYPGQKVVILLSDGEDSASIRNRAYQEIVELAAIIPNLTIFPVGLDLDSRSTFEGPDRRTMLAELAHATGGSFYEVKHVNKLSDAFARIERRLAGKSFITYIPAPFGRGPRDQAEVNSFRWRQVAIAAAPKLPCKVIALSPPVRLEGYFEADPAPVEMTAAPRGSWVAPSAQACFFGAGFEIEAGLQVPGVQGGKGVPAGVTELWSLDPSHTVLGKVPDITRERSVLYDDRLFRRSGQLRLRMQNEAAFRERTFAVDVPPLDLLRETLVEPEDVMIRLLGKPPCAVSPMDGGDDHLGPLWVHGQTFLEMREALGLALFRFYPEYAAWATNRLKQDSGPEVEALLLHLSRQPDTTPEEIERAGRALEARAEHPEHDQPQRYLAEWLGDIPARELAIRVERRAAAAYLRSSREGGELPELTRTIMNGWENLGVWLPPPTRVRILTPLIPAYDPERDVIGFYRVALPNPRVGARPVGQVPEAPYGLLTLLWIMEHGNVEMPLGGLRLARLDYDSIAPSTARRLVNGVAHSVVGEAPWRPVPTRRVRLEFDEPSGHNGSLAVTAYVSRVADLTRPDDGALGGPFCIDVDATAPLGGDLERFHRALTELIDIDIRACPDPDGNS